MRLFLFLLERTHCPGIPDPKNTEVRIKSCFIGQEGRTPYLLETACAVSAKWKAITWNQCDSKLKLGTKCDQQSRSSLQLLFCVQACSCSGTQEKVTGELRSTRRGHRQHSNSNSNRSFCPCPGNIQRHHFSYNRSKTGQDNATKQALTMGRKTNCSFSQLLWPQ